MSSWWLGWGQSWWPVPCQSLWFLFHMAVTQLLPHQYCTVLEGQVAGTARASLPLDRAKKRNKNE